MDRRERFYNPLIATRALLKSWQATISTAIPGIYKGAGRGGTANVLPAIRGKHRDQKGEWQDADLPMCLDCPIVWPGGGAFQLTFPLADGDEGLLIFSQRCIDAWWQSGGVQSQAELRMHDLSDGFFLPARLSQAKAPSAAPSSNSVQLRSADGSTFVEIASGGAINFKATTVTIQGDLHATGAIIAGHGGGSQVGLQSHLHAGVQVGGGSTTAPTAGT